MKFLGRAKLFYVFFIVLLVVSAVPLLAFTLYKVRIEKEGYVEEIYDDQMGILSEASKKLSLFFSSIVNEARFQAQVLATSSFESVEEFANILQSGFSQAGLIPKRVSLLDSTGKVLLSYDTGRVGRSEVSVGGAELSPSSLDALKKGGFFISGVYLSRDLGHLLFDVLVPVKGVPEKVLKLSIDPSVLLFVLGEKQSLEHEVSLLDQNGNFVIANSRVRSFVAPYWDKRAFDIMRRSVSGNLGFASVGQISYVPGRFKLVNPPGWLLIVRTPEYYVAARMEALTRSNMSILVLTILIVAFCSAFLSRFVTFPIGKLRSVADEVAKRNYSPLIVKDVPPVYDEVGRIARAFRQMIGSVQLHHEEVIRTRDALTFGLVTIVEFRDPETGYHVERLARYSKALSEALRRYTRVDGITDEFIEDIFRAAPLHDVGKVAIPDSILLKPAGLTKEEFEIMKTHTVLGAQAINALERRLPNVSFLAMARGIALSHHEWWNGEGYPEGKRGLDILLPARIVAIADFYDALSFSRPYRPEALSHEEITKLIEGRRGTHFDPDIVDAFLKIQEEFIRVRTELADTTGMGLTRLRKIGIEIPLDEA